METGSDFVERAKFRVYVLHNQSGLKCFADAFRRFGADFAHSFANGLRVFGTDNWKF